MSVILMETPKEFSIGCKGDLHHLEISNQWMLYGQYTIAYALLLHGMRQRDPYRLYYKQYDQNKHMTASTTNRKRAHPFLPRERVHF